MARIRTLRSNIPVLDQRTAKPEPKSGDPFYSSQPWLDLVARLIKERGSRCQYCQRLRRVVGEHVHELRDGGEPLNPDNIKLSCWPCHTKKTNAERARRIAAPVGGPRSES